MPKFEVIKHRGGDAKLIGYARVSTRDQKLASQLDVLKKHGCCRVYAEHISGGAEHRAGHAAMLDTLRPGDVVVVATLDRLGRKMSELVLTLDRIRELGCHFRDLRHGVDTSSTQGKLLLHMLMVFAEAQRDLIRENTRAGLEAARERGRVPGRPTVIPAPKRDQIRHLRAQGWSLQAIADTVNVSKTSVWKALDTMEPKGDPKQLRIEGS